MRDYKPRRKLVLNEATDESTRVVDESGPSSRVDETNTLTQSRPSQSLSMPRHNERVISQPNYYIDKDQWVKVMDLEMESMYFNLVWELVDLPKGVKPIGCKWIYKRKRDSTRNIQIFKARLVAKGYTQREGVDDEETFSSVAMLKEYRYVLARGVHNPRYGVHLSKEQRPKTLQRVEDMRLILYATIVGSLMYAMLCTGQTFLMQ
ncbi:gag/pol protein [Cucumis melo var. makuwa]|uniref:Gag/pol protein n=1 Tax=Cucumis melo var. makuwa TaxID=1194695 RepID=A0A5A7TI40_CUCMM|nr:gag/pol protein [Cucumis melo var. makuwa]TYK02757.1 gag/pol protein [Cucumis melo var. makuwa]